MLYAIKTSPFRPESESDSSKFLNIRCLEKMLSLVDSVSRKSCQINLVIAQMEPPSDEIKLVALQLAGAVRKVTQTLVSEINRLKS